MNYKKNLSENVLFPTDDIPADVKTLIEEITPSVGEKISSSYWSIETVDSVTGLVFEKIICDLYNAMKDCSAEKTPGSNDFGADVVVKSLTNNTGFLIQCKHTENPDSSINNRGVQEIFAAVAHYEKKYSGRKFQPVVVTNAKSFTNGAIKLASENNVKLVDRQKLGKMFCQYKILRC